MQKYLYRFCSFSEKKLIGHLFAKNMPNPLIFKQIQDNIQNIQNIETLCVIIEKIPSLQQNINETLEESILTQTQKAFQNYDIKLDQGDALKRIILTVCLNKYGSKESFKSFFKNIDFLFDNRMQSADLKNILTILESLIYNQIFPPKNLSALFEILYSKLDISDMELYPKIINLILYIYKDQSNQDIEKLSEKINHLFFDIINNSQKDILSLSETLNYVINLNNIKKNQKYNQMILQKYEKIIKANFIGNKQIEFRDGLLLVMKFQEQPLFYIHQTLLERLIMTYQYEFNNNQQIKFVDQIYYLTFLQNNVKSFEIPQEVVEKLLKQSEDENNLLILIKFLDILSKIQRRYSIEQIEDKIIKQSQKIQKPQKILINLLQILVRMKAGQDKTFYYLFDFFTYSLEKLNYTEIFIKLIPSAALKTQAIFKIYSTNTTTHNSAFLVQKKKVIDEQKTILLEFWKKVSNYIQKNNNTLMPNVYPSIVFYFTYVNIFEEQFQDLFIHCLKQIQNNLQSYNQKQLAQFIYAFGRNKHIPITNNLLKTIPYLKIESDIIQNINIYWGLGKQHVLSQKINEEIEKNIFNNFEQLSQESFVQFVISFASFYGKQRTSQIQGMIIRQFPKLKLNTQQLFQLSQSLILLNIFDQKIWQIIINHLVKDQKNWTQDLRNINYLYSIYFNLKLFTNNKLMIEPLIPILKERFQPMLQFVLKYKKNFKSQFEKQIIEEIQKQTKNVSYQKSDFHFYNDLSNELIGKLSFSSDLKLVPFTIDFLQGNQAYEINGPNHYFKTDEGYHITDGETSHKRDILELLEFDYIEFLDYKNQEFENVEQYVQKVLKHD